MPEQPGPALAVALIVLLAIAVTVSYVGRLRLERRFATAALRAVVQLALVSLVIAAVLVHIAWSAAFALVMMGVAVATAAGRIGAPRAWPWVAVAIAAGVLPVLTVIFVAGAVPFTGAGLVPMAGIIIGGAMTATSLAGRRAFAALRDEHGTYEAALSIGLPRSAAVTEVIERHLPEALVPGMDQTRTVGLVTLPGAFVGVLLGGGSPVQAGAAQIIVLVGLLATQAITVVVVGRLIRSARLLPADLKDRLIP
ncbi:ABC transporter permease [Microlunatus ginsengisoli]|uniref:ABC transporter permease n=1 Tax=Microlunatus ginsengisoli TaxID=363863 RepID=A0ABP6ZBY8_9ACTN